jgi:hypothetical protein
MLLELWVDMIIIYSIRCSTFANIRPNRRNIIFNSFILRSIKTTLIDVFKETQVIRKCFLSVEIGNVYDDNGNLQFSRMKYLNTKADNNKTAIARGW